MRKGNQAVPSKKRTKRIQRRGRRSGKGERIRRWKPLHIGTRILGTIAIFMVTPTKKVFETTSRDELEEPQEGQKEIEPSSHIFEKSG
jgi:hypothetical protein